jgi:hypothetical protein
VLPGTRRPQSCRLRLARVRRLRPSLTMYDAVAIIDGRSIGCSASARGGGTWSRHLYDRVPPASESHREPCSHPCASCDARSSLEARSMGPSRHPESSRPPPCSGLALAPVQQPKRPHARLSHLGPPLSIGIRKPRSASRLPASAIQPSLAPWPFGGPRIREACCRKRAQAAVRQRRRLTAWLGWHLASIPTSPRPARAISVPY